MRRGFVLAVVGVLGCSPSSPSASSEKPAASPAEPSPQTAETPEAPETPQTPEVPETAIEVLMTAATLADDCGGVPNMRPSPAPPKSKAKAKAKRRPMTEPNGKSDRARKAKRCCKQSSIQLAINAPAGASPATVTVKSVELLLESGESLGMLEARSPSVWSDGEGYAPWGERIEPGQDLSVSYGVSQPDWDKVEDRRSKRYTMKAVVSISGADQTLEQNVVVDTPTSLPPNVKT